MQDSQLQPARVQQHRELHIHTKKVPGLTVRRRCRRRTAPQDVRHWLQLVGHGEEGEWIDLGTVRGYHRIVFCQSIRDDVDTNLGQGEWARLLPALCQGRLVPTEWLNKVREACCHHPLPRQVEIYTWGRWLLSTFTP